MILKFTARVKKIRTGSISALPPDPRASVGWGLSPQTPKTAPNCEFLAMRLRKVISRKVFKHASSAARQ